jgi:amino acid adenylation domain-containing protein
VIPRRQRISPAPTSFAQRRLWFLDRLDPGSPAYNLPFAVRLQGGLHVRSLQRMFEALIARHAALRTSFDAPDGEPLQVIASNALLRIAIIDLQLMPPATRPAAAHKWVRTVARVAFDLTRPPLMRVALVRMDDDDHVLVIVLHHIIADASSVAILRQEVSALYSAALGGEAAALPALPIDYADFAAWEQSDPDGDRLASDESTWREQLRSMPSLDLATDFPRPLVPRHRGAHQRLPFSAELHAALSAVGRQQRATFFIVLLAGVAALLQRYTGQSDIVIGAPVANRMRETRDIVGCFLNILVLRVNAGGNPSFETLIERVRETAIRAYEMRNVPFERLAELLDGGSAQPRVPLFRVMLTTQVVPDGKLTLEGLTMSRFEVEDIGARFDLTVSVTERTGHSHGTITYDTDLFEPETIRRFGLHLNRLLTAAVADTQMRISALPILDDAERAELLRAGIGPTRVTGQTVHELVRLRALENPDTPALVEASQAWSYADLDRRANQIAHRLRERGIRPRQVVAVLRGRSAETIACLLGIMKAGCAYLPLDPAWPPARLSLVLEEARPRLVITEQAAPRGLPLGVPVFDLNGDRQESTREPIADPHLAIEDDDPVYLIYTSGSTGQPKGVVMPHRGLANTSLSLAAIIGLGPGQRFLQFAPLTFDVSAFQIFPALVSGAALVLHPDPGRLSHAELMRLCEAHEVTVLDLPAALWRAWVADLAARGARAPTGIRVFMTGGESVPSELVHAWAGLVRSDARLLSSYGPTEAAATTVLTTAATGAATLTTTTLPLGVVLPGVQIFLLDRELQPAPRGTTGEIYIGGVCLADGYLGAPAATADRFVPNPFDITTGARLYRTGDLARVQPSTGRLEFQGRRDDQVKIRGYRVEVAEIEAALLAHPGVRRAAVVQDPDEASRLVACVIAGDPWPTPDALRERLRARLPAHMVPSAIFLVDHLPVMSNGKLDRRRLAQQLPADVPAGPPAQPARTATEEILLGLWAELLGHDGLSVTESFFDAGGHSLSATRLIARVQQVLDVDVPLRAFFESPTVAALATYIDQHRPTGLAPRPALKRRETSDAWLPLSSAQEALWMLEQMEPGNPALLNPDAVRLLGDLDIPALAWTLNAIVRRHESLRTVFGVVGGAVRQYVCDDAPRVLPLVDLGACSPAARARLLLTLTRREQSRRFDLATGPLLRAAVIQLAPREHVVLLTMHHIISDGWSMGVLIREVSELYSRRVRGSAEELPKLPLQYADYALWQREQLDGPRAVEQIEYWMRRFAEGVSELELPSDRPRAAVSRFRGARHAFWLTDDQAETLRLFSRREGTTLFMTMLAAFNVMLHAYTGQEQLLVVTAVAGRDPIETEPLIGFFINHVPLLTTVTPDMSFRQVLRSVRETVLDAFTHQALPFNELVRRLKPERESNYAPLHRALFNLLNVPMLPLQLEGLEVFRAPTAPRESSKFDLSLHINATADGLASTFEYDTQLFETATIHEMTRRYEATLDEAITSPDAPISRFAFATRAQAAQLDVFNEVLE